MSGRLVLRPKAELDIQSARDWYEARSAGLGRSFVEAVSSTLDHIAGSPQLHAERWRGVRACRVGRFPYTVYYRDLPDRTEVLAVLHQRRSPRLWKSRAGE